MSTVPPLFWQRRNVLFFGYNNVQNCRYLNHIFEIKIYIHSYNSLYVVLNISGFKICKPSINPLVFVFFFWGGGGGGGLYVFLLLFFLSFNFPSVP